MRPHLAILGARFRLLLQYRAAALAGLGTQLFFGAVLVAVMRAFYGSSDAAQPMNLAQVVSYLWLGQAFFALLPWRGDPDIVALVRNGGIAYELLRPVNLYGLWFARAVAMRTAPVLLRAVPLLLVAGLFLGLTRPASPQAALLWLAALAGAVALSAAFTVLLNLSLLWTVSGEGISLFLPAAMTVCSGLLLPLPLFPAAMQTVLNWLPFRGLMDVPHRVYLGELTGAAAGGALLQQWLWVAALVLAGLALLRRGLKRLVVQGG
jgi:ABC-2 type transport system permease protein